MARLWLKLRLILWKNLIIRKRHWLLSILEIVIPVLLCLGSIFLTSLIPKPYISETAYYTPKTIDFHDGNVRLYYAPNTPAIKKFMADVNISKKFRK